jgi:hypothetical protein
MNDPTVSDSMSAGVASVVEVFPVAIGHYRNFPDLDVAAQVGRLLDLLAPFGGRHHQWAAPALERGASVVELRLLEWAESGDTADAPPGSVLYWVGHGWSDGAQAALAHADSPARVGSAGVTPEQLADAIRTRQALVHDRKGSDGSHETWVLVVVDTCRSRGSPNCWPLT